MRKLLLASAAMLGGTLALATGASAQNLTNNVPAGATAISSPSFGTEIQSYTSNPPMAASTMTVRLMGRLNFEMAAGSDSGRNPPGATDKQANYDLYEYARLYPSFDAVAANGLRYGAFLEIRQDTGAGAGGGATKNAINGSGSVSGSDGSRGELYFRREMGYFGADQFGFLRLGATDQPTSLFVTGTMENFDMGGWNGDLTFFSGNAAPTGVPFPDVGNLYSTSKAVYVSPKFFNLVDFGVSFEPNTGTVGYSANSCSSGLTTGCDAASSTTSYAESARRRNTIDGVVRLRTAIGPVGVAATVGGMTSGKVNYIGAPLTTPGQSTYKVLNVIDAGAQVTWGGLAVAAHVDEGDFNGQWSLSPTGGKKSLFVIGGASYAIGPVIAGVQLFDYKSPGSWTNNTTGVSELRNEYGVAAGSTVTVAPGAFVFLSYLYGHRHQDGVNLLNGDAGATNADYKQHNNTQAQAVILGTMLRW